MPLSNRTKLNLNLKQGLRLDPRWFQLLFLSGFLVMGWWVRDFSLHLSQFVLTIASCVFTQYICILVFKPPQLTSALKSALTRGFSSAISQPTQKEHSRSNDMWALFLSPLITSLGMSILIRSDNYWAHPLLGCLAISSKFIIRIGAEGLKSHVFNPANLAVFLAWRFDVVLETWISPAQWGSINILALWFFALGGIVTQRIKRLDISLTFLATWATLAAGRLIYLQYSWDPGLGIWIQQMSAGSILLFSFFMISDPMTTPQNRTARMIYAVAIACSAFAWQWVFYRPNGLVVVLFFGSMLVPLINVISLKCTHVTKFDWRRIS